MDPIFMPLSRDSREALVPQTITVIPITISEHVSTGDNTTKIQVVNQSETLPH